MNAQLAALLLKPTKVQREPVRLSPIPWGKPDRSLARALCAQVQDVTPAITVPFNPAIHRRVRNFLRAHAIAH